MRARRRRRRIHARDGSIGPVAATKGSPSEQHDNSQGIKEQDYNSEEGKRMRYSEPTLPEDILRHIHSLLPLRYAARAACVSRAFLNSWRCRPNLYFSKEELGSKAISYGDDVTRDFTTKVDHVLKKHSGIGLKTLSLFMFNCYSLNSCHLDSWLHLAITSGIEELIIVIPSKTQVYNFPLSLLSGKSGNSIQYLSLNLCAFRPTMGLGCFRILKRLHLTHVSIAGDELGCLLSDSLALERLELIYCNEIICLKIPRLLLRLIYLEVTYCDSLQVIESEAPNLSSFRFTDFPCHHVQLSLGEALQVKTVRISHLNAVYYARSELPTIMPNLESLTIFSMYEMASTPSVPSKFCHLKYLNIRVPGPDSYDYSSLASFLDASPSLETFILCIHVPETRVEHGLFSGDPSHLRQTPEHRHNDLKRVEIDGFFPAKSLLELACYVLESAASLECLTLGTSYCKCWRRDSETEKCFLLAIRRHFEGRVPPTARLDVEGPCSGVRLGTFRWQGITVF